MTSKIEKQTITFPNRNSATVVTVPADASAEAIIQELGLAQPKALIILSGGAAGLDESIKPKIYRLLDRAVAQVAAELGALIIDGGTQSGVMALMGKAVEECEYKIPLLGVAPVGKVTFPNSHNRQGEKLEQLEENHSHFVLVDCPDWGCENKTIFTVAKYFSKDTPVVTVLVNGGQNAKEEVRQSVRQRWPVIVIEKTGRLADELANTWNKKQKKHGAVEAKDPAINEIVEDGNITLFNLDTSPEALKSVLAKTLRLPGNATLHLAWERFATYDYNATVKQHNFNWLQTPILLLGVLTSALALTYTQFQLQITSVPLFGQGLSYIIIFLPIGTSVLIAGANRFRAGNRWVLLRTSAESVKREIYCFRTQTKAYGSGQSKTTREIVLHNKVETIGRRLMQTEVNLCALQPYCGVIPPKMYGAGAKDDGYSDLSADQYLKIRVGDQLSYYQKKTVKLEKNLKRMQWSIYALGGVGTFLAAVGLQLWIALTTTLVGVVTLYLEYQQVESTLTKYNQAANDLDNLRSWWTALSNDEKANQKNVEQLVDLTESVLSTEMAGWGQRMDNALSKLQTFQAEQIPKNQNQLEGTG